MQALNPKKVSAALQALRGKIPAGEHMGPKLLFFFGIVVTHGALGAALMRQQSPLTPVSVSTSTCVQSPTPLPYFGRQGELEMLAQVLPAENDSGASRP
jgi:hypothetical protein